ncbi:D-alanine--D-alanine ligase [Loigolactobacillus coryniformis subsp. coryniformis]|uniref:D-alanine--D-alanine ligase n=1 Tax=Loigolactobacillus coryniformis subsp. coryniformis KCTC 3167 = DSM 20001 TaxID=913848 RepID=A0A0R1EXT5_9LACO|nr:D-alanine--D-alanine ligase [Loigolactobacillus coryniformis]ATO56291.1 D-alanine--D-alanine ligase [Loigolactobacillus coryniformis subsp. coryniformis KCTC 3167 = DSM 20001]KRK14341.1 D-alanine--D-alanine ligase [Loigolactobacillus coryniformis subsp. coryniformis KCTC 3167 = DSM 20001]OEH90384.1 D-alanine--D-alanine ligase [Loigolactobacillus coryniformis subsp. coryniformis]
MKIVVLAGGRSPERNVSLSSGAKITNALREKGHAAVLIDLFLGDDLSDVETIAAVFQRPAPSTDYAISEEVLTNDAIDALRTTDSKGLFGPNVLKICGAADIVFLGLHGEDGENGKVQATLDLFGIPYTGSGFSASGITMNKHLAKQLLQHNQINTARYQTIKAGESVPQLAFDFPMVVKPTHGGSSIGMEIVPDRPALIAALTEAGHFDNEVVVEEYIAGREFSVGVLNGQALPAIEITVADGWYDYEHKYQDNGATYQTPPHIPATVHQEMQQMALATMQVLGLTNYGRIDFLWDGQTIYVIEGNSLPGMTPHSLLPQEAAAVGISYADLCEQIIAGQLDA